MRQLLLCWYKAWFERKSVWNYFTGNAWRHASQYNCATLKIIFLREVTNNSHRSCNKPTGGGLRVLTSDRGITRKRITFTGYAWTFAKAISLVEPVAFVNKLWLACHRPCHKGTILKRFYPGSDLLVTKWHWNLELQHVLSCTCKLFVSLGKKQLNR